MDNDVEKILKGQIGKLPSTVVDFISSTSWDTDVNEIGSLYNLSEEELGNLNREVTLVLAGLVHPDEFRDALEEEGVVTNSAMLDSLVANVEKKIFFSIRPALIEFFEKEELSEAAPIIKETVVEKPKAPAVQMYDVAPDNLPTGETESFLPNLAPKTNAEAGEPAHPFEEKMKRVFTAGQQSMSDLAIEPEPQAPLEVAKAPSVPLPPTGQVIVAQVPKAPPAKQADPYREAIE